MRFHFTWHSASDRSFPCRRLTARQLLRFWNTAIALYSKQGFIIVWLMRYYQENKGRWGERARARSLHRKLLQKGIVWRSRDYFRVRAAEGADVKDSDSLAERSLLLQIYFLIEVLWAVSCTWSLPLPQWLSSKLYMRIPRCDAFVLKRLLEKEQMWAKELKLAQFKLVHRLVHLRFVDHFDRAPHQILRASCLCKAVKLSEAEKQGELSWRKVRCEDMAHILWKMAALKACPRTFVSVVWLYLDHSIVCSWDFTVNLSDIAFYCDSVIFFRDAMVRIFF